MDEVKSWARKGCNSRHAQVISTHISESREWVSDNPRNTLYGALSILAIVYFSIEIVQRLRKPATPSRPGTPDLEKEKPIVSEEAKKNKFACEVPGGTFRPSFLCHSPTNHDGRMATFLFPSPSSSAIPRLGHRNHQTPRLPSFPPKILRYNGSPLHALGLLDRTR